MDPDSVAGSDTALILIGRSVETLMQSAFDAPVLADGGKPLDCVQSIRSTAGDQVDRLWLVFADVTIELCNLFDVWEAGTFRGCRLCVNLPLFRTPAIDLVGPSQRRRHELRGKRPPAWRRSVCARFV